MEYLQSKKRLTVHDQEERQQLLAPSKRDDGDINGVGDNCHSHAAWNQLKEWVGAWAF